MKNETLNMHMLWKMSNLFFEVQPSIAFQKELCFLKINRAKKIEFLWLKYLIFENTYVIND